MKITDLPKDPIETLKAAAIEATRFSRGQSITLEQLLQKNHPSANWLTICNTIIRKSSRRILDSELRDLVDRILDGDKSRGLSAWSNDYDLILQAVIAYQLDEHFENQEDIVLFEHATLDVSDKDKIRELMVEARRATDRAENLREKQRRKVLYYISKIENELHKDTSNFAVFTSGWAEINEMVAATGEALKPVAEALRISRTIAQVRVEGHRQIEKEEEPKQITDQTS